LHKRELNRREIMALTGQSYNTVCNAVRAYELDGANGIEAGTRGRRAGEKRKLTAARADEIR
jgi:transposase